MLEVNYFIIKLDPVNHPYLQLKLGSYLTNKNQKMNSCHWILHGTAKFIRSTE